MTTARPPEVWFLTGSQGLYGAETLRPGRRPVAAIAEPARRLAPTCRSQVVWKPVLLDAGAIRRPMLDANSDDGVHRRDRLDAHVLAGEDVDRRPRRAAQAAAAPAHAGQRGAAVVDDRHGLHEPQPGRARRPGVRLHPDPARRRPQDRRRPRQRPGGRPRASAPGRAPRSGRAELRTLKLARFGDNMRDVAVTEGDKVEAQLRFGVSVNTYGVNDLVAVVDACSTTTSTSSSPSTTTPYGSRPSCSRGEQCRVAVRRDHERQVRRLGRGEGRSHRRGRGWRLAVPGDGPLPRLAGHRDDLRPGARGRPAGLPVRCPATGWSGRTPPSVVTTC